jgi:hypothetical protein
MQDSFLAASICLTRFFPLYKIAPELKTNFNFRQMFGSRKTVATIDYQLSLKSLRRGNAGGFEQQLNRSVLATSRAVCVGHPATQPLK